MNSVADGMPLDRLQRLCAGLCRDAGVKVVSDESAHWAWFPEQGIITVPASDLIYRSLEYCSGVLSHEVGHVLITRAHPFLSQRNSREKLRYLFFNAIEDTRVNTWIAERYPGTAAWHQEMARVDLKPLDLPLLPSLRFGLECAREQYLDWQSADVVGPVPSLVLTPLTETRADRFRFARSLPPTEIGCEVSKSQVGAGPEQRLAAARAHQPVEVPESAWERMVLLRQWDAVEIARDRIVPAFESLLDHEIAAIAAYLRERPSAMALATRLLRGNKRFHKRSVKKVPDFYHAICDWASQPQRHADPKPALKKLCTDLIWLITSRTMASHGRQSASTQTAEPGAGAASARPRDCGAATSRSQRMPKPVENGSGQNECGKYADTFARLRPQISRLCREFDELIQPRKRGRERLRFSSGTRVDLRELVAFEADPRRYRKLWQRKSPPDQRSLAVSLLVDLSGSMKSGARIDAAFAGTVFMANVLHQQGVCFAINGFQDQLIPLHSFGETFGNGSGRILEGMFEEVHGRRPGGRNRPDSNADGPCLRQAAAELESRSETDRLLIVISDGLPTHPEPDPCEELTRAIVETTSRSPTTKLVGLGLGEDTEHVARFYPHGKACIPEEQLATEIGRLLRGALLELIENDPVASPEAASP